MINTLILGVLIFLAVAAQFILIMKIHHKAHNKILHTIMAIIFLPQNAFVNITIMTVVGMELPQEWLVTSRMKRWKKTVPTTFRRTIRHNVGYFLCDWMNKHDIGHC